MPSLTANCLTVVPFDTRNIESIASAAGDMSREKLIEMLVRVCLSHERLREELTGAEEMLRHMDQKMAHGCTDANCAECDGDVT